MELDIVPSVGRLVVEVCAGVRDEVLAGGRMVVVPDVGWVVAELLGVWPVELKLGVVDGSIVGVVVR